jgi:hypothetical protein
MRASFANGDAPSVRQRTHKDSLRFAAFDPVQEARLDHPVERIDAVAGDAIPAGSQGSDLHFTSVSLKHDANAVSTCVHTPDGRGQTSMDRARYCLM